MKVKDVMSRNCTFITPQTTLAEAARIMADQDIGFVPVAESDRMIGMVTDRDIVIRGVAKGADPKAPVRDVMTGKTYYCFDDESAEDVCANMAELKVRRLPVVNREKRLIGVVSIGDLAQDVNKIKVGQTIQTITDPANDKRAA